MVDHLAPVNNKVKGLLKGLRYISQIFDGEKEQEMVIGNPTDVKHVAHIGWEGPSAPINEFNTSSLGQDGKEFGSTAAAEEIPHGSPSREMGGSPKPRRTRHHTTTETGTTEAGTQEPHESHHSRKSRSSGSGSSDSQSQEGHRSRHHRHHSKHHNSASGSESTNQEVLKKSRKKERRRRGSDGGEDKVTEEAF